jgi:hypothetical protein
MQLTLPQSGLWHDGITNTECATFNIQGAYRFVQKVRGTIQILSMLSFTLSPPGAVIYSAVGHFISSEQEHLLVVKIHSIEYYSISEFDDPPSPEIDIPLATTICGASKFSLPGSCYDNLAILSVDFTLIVLTHSGSQESDVPFERTVSDNLRNMHVLPTRFFPLFAAVENHLFISIYPNSLSLITCCGESLEKNEIHFKKLMPTFLGTFGRKLVIIEDSSTSRLKLLDIAKLPDLLGHATADSSAALEIVNVPFNEEHFFMRNNIFYAFGNRLVRRFDFERELDWVILPITSTVVATNLTAIAFANGDIFSFDPDSLSFAPICHQHGVEHIVDLRNGRLLLVVDDGPPVVYDRTENSVISTFSQNSTQFETAVVVPHSIVGTEALIVAGLTDLSRIGYAQVF